MIGGKNKMEKKIKLAKVCFIDKNEDDIDTDEVSIGDGVVTFFLKGSLVTIPLQRISAIFQREEIYKENKIKK